MSVRLLQFVLIIGAFKGTWEKNHGIETRADIEKILKAIKSSEDSNEDNHGHKDKEIYINRNGNYNAEIIDLNTLNSIVKRIMNSDKREQFNEDAFNSYFRNQNEELCQKIGRCGCRPGITRCGDTVVSSQKTVKDMENLINGLQEKVDRGLDSEEGKEDDLYYKNKHNVDKYNSKNYIDLNNVFSDRDDLFGEKDLFKLGKQKTYNLNSVSDYAPNYKTYRYDENGPFILQLDDVSNEPELMNNDERKFPRSENINPDVFFKHFNHMRENMINILFEYVTNDDKNPPSIVYDLNNWQLRKVKELKYEISRNKKGLTNEKIKTRINAIVFGNYNKIKIIPNDNLNNILVPSWIYNFVVSRRAKYFRLPKRIVPLTKKERNRSMSKNKNPKQSPTARNIYRRSFYPDLQDYAIPFELSVQGLAQYNN